MPQPTNTPPPQPTNTPSAPTPGQTLYTADWSSGRNGWSLPQGWDTVSAELVNDGTSDADLTKLAHPPTIIPYTANYAAEADIQMVRPTSATLCNFSTSGFGLAMREDSTGVYVVGMATASQGSSWMGTIADTGGEVGDPCDLVTQHALATNNFNLDTSWHTYRVEVRGNDIKLLIDGNSVVETTDNHHLRSNAVGMWCAGTVINVRSFKVIAL